MRQILLLVVAAGLLSGCTFAVSPSDETLQRIDHNFALIDEWRKAAAQVLKAHDDRLEAHFPTKKEEKK